VRRLVQNLGPNPGCLLGRRWDYLAWNDAFRVVFGCEPGPDPLSLYHVWLTFMEPSRRQQITDWEQGVCDAVFHQGELWASG
jgi:hypothetical protein